MNTRIRTIAATAGLVALGALNIAQAADFDDVARVVQVVPRVVQVNQPQQQCQTETVQTQGSDSRSAGGSIIGGIAGAILGNQVGGGNGRTAATAAGAIAGAVVGDRVQNDQPNGGTRQVQRCTTVDRWQSRTEGYDVTYDYQGRRYTSFMNYDPGDRLHVRVSVTPRS